MENQSTKPPKPQRYLILDTNIFKYLGNEELYPQIMYLLRDAVSKGYALAISKFTLLELLDTSTVENELKAFTYIKGIRHFQINQTVLITAGHLGCLYKEDGIENQPEIGDKILAATACVNNAVIFTTNGRHFPSPFFNTLGKPILKYTKSKADVHMVAYFLEPDYGVISTKYQARTDEFEKKGTIKNKEDIKNKH